MLILLYAQAPYMSSLGYTRRHAVSVLLVIIVAVRTFKIVLTRQNTTHVLLRYEHGINCIYRLRRPLEGSKRADKLKYHTYNSNTVVLFRILSRYRHAIKCFTVVVVVRHYLHHETRRRNGVFGKHRPLAEKGGRRTTSV